MNRSPLPAAAALAAAAALLLAGCGSSTDSSKGADKITGADQDDTNDTPPPSPSASGAAKRPTITLPSDVNNVFETWKTGDAAKDALLTDVKERVNATDAAIVAGNPDSEALEFYYKGEALADAAEWVQGYVNDGKSITGTVRFYNPDLLMVDKDTAALAYCADESKAFDKDRKSNKAEKNPVSKDSYVAYNTRVQRTAQGIWQTTSLLSDRGSAKCTP
ncbi:lipoprotein [Streptomyces levis]|uniref:Lipoprotein n=1 Tax=Streptomyces levis TaxID=285566 RepID=A0ABN3P211_9ACTN